MVEVFFVLIVRPWPPLPAARKVPKRFCGKMADAPLLSIESRPSVMSLLELEESLISE